MIDKLQFISNQTEEISHLESIKLALDAGCTWIQLRVKNQPYGEMLKIADQAKILCDIYRAKLIINDFPLIAKDVGACGLHLGLDDMSINNARQIVDNKIIIGGTANSLQDILMRVNEGADYVGLGPFRFTSTKQKLSPILGLEGYSQMMKSLQALGCNIPVIAIGGITPLDVAEILKTGIYGIAMSGSIIESNNQKDMIYKINKILC